ncbi:hypothetical protein K438DRAFT_2009677 [Mycena galopus ATCC 62051]|nr:hypothetical protein K438DRAFT_2009677 [Mycena galopus ATCC 62051]
MSLQPLCSTSVRSDPWLCAAWWPRQHLVLLVLCGCDCLNVEHEAGPRLSLGPKTTRPELRRRRRERLSDPLCFPPGGCKHFGPSAFGQFGNPICPWLRLRTARPFCAPRTASSKSFRPPRGPRLQTPSGGWVRNPRAPLSWAPQLKTFGSTNSTLIVG